MNDWRGIARCAASGIPAENVEHIAARLEALEEKLAPLFAKLTPEIEPAVLFHMQEDRE